MSKFEDYYDHARSAYLEGKTLQEIADQFGIAISTISKWKQQGEWEKSRISQRKERTSLEERLQKQIDSLMSQLESSPAGENNNALVDQMSKMAKTIEYLRTKRDPLGATILVVEELVPWIQKTDVELAAKITGLLPGFFEYMRGKNG